MASITLSETVSGASSYENQTESGVPLVFGGLGGLAGTCSTEDNINTCNSCTSPATSSPCNENRIYNNLNFSISLSSDTVSSGNVIITTDDGETVLSLLVSETAGKDNYGLVTTTWSEICDKIDDAATDCDSYVSAGILLSDNLRVGIDGDSDSKLSSTEDDYVDISFRVYSPETTTTDSGTNCSNIHGVCSIDFFPGDEKVYLKSLVVPDSFSTVTSTILVTKLRVMFSELNFDDLGLDTNYKDFDIIDGGTNISGFIDGLKNDTPYVFKFASIDSTGNIFNILDATAYSSTSICNKASNASPLISDSCPYIATPGKVLGLLSDDLNCFIATASFGSSWSPPLKILREFRNKFLLTNEAGKAFVLSYYKYGSKASHWIIKNPIIKLFSQLLLWPIWLFAWTALSFGLSISFLFLSFTFFVFIRLSLVTSRKLRCRI